MMTLVFASAATFGQASDVAKIEQLEKELTAFFTAGKFKEALPVAKQIVALNEAGTKPKGAAMATAYTNLGLIERALEKYADASADLMKAIEITNSLTPVPPVASQIKLLGLLADCQNMDKQYKDAAVTFSTILNLLEKSGTHESVEAYELLLGAANNQAQAKNFAAANDLYKKALKVSSLHFEENSEEGERLMLFRTCYFLRFVKDGSDLRKDYLEYEKKLLKTDASDGEFLNGKAIDLPRPEYPAEARARGLSGAVYVRVHIDRQGKVSKADVICSDPILGAGAIQSAKRARFSPTLRNGQPVEASGLIIYNFVAPR